LGLSRHTLPENDGPNSSGGHEDDATANVVHFPRDWFGPHEELVPFGPGAEEGARDDAGTPTPLEPVTPPPVRADDFWGEDSASIHNAMQAPVTPDPFAKPEPVAAPDPVAEPEPVAVAGERSPSRAWRPSVGGLPARRRAVTWVGLGAAAITLVVVTLGSLRPQMIRAGGSGGAVPALTPAVIGDVPPAIASHPAGSGASHRRAGRGTGRVHVHASRARAHVTASAASSTTSTRVASASPQTSATTQSSSAASQGSESASSTGASSDSGGGSARSQPAGPVGAGAPFGPGHLG
jgi:hypothetical protein